MPAALPSMVVPRSFADEVPLPPTVKTPGELLGGLDEVLEGLVGAVIPDEQDIRGALEHVDLLEVQGLVPGIPHLQGLENRMGQVVARDRVSVGFGLDQFRPAEGPAAADLVVDRDIDAEDLLQGCLLKSCGDIRLPAGVETDVIGDPLAGELLRCRDCPDPNQSKDGRKNDTTDDLFFHSLPPENG